VLLRFANIQNGTASVSMRQAAWYASSGPAPLPVDLNTAYAARPTPEDERRADAQCIGQP
jgi:hypothetical protein